MQTFNLKTILVLLILVITLVATTATYLLELVNFPGKDQFFIPLIIGLILTLVRFFNNIQEKAKISELIRQKYDESLDQSKIKFETCPEYWTKETKDDKVYCHNKFTDIDGNVTYVGGDLTDKLNIDLLDDSASNIGFKFDLKENTKDDGTTEVTLNNREYTGISDMRSNLILPEELKGKEEFTIEGYEDLDKIKHKHRFTYVNYAHKDAAPEVWADGKDREHPDVYNDDKHLQIFNYDLVHTHDSGKILNEKGEEITDISELMVKDSEIKQQFSNDTNWISPFKEEDTLYAEINLTELNKSKNKCELAKNLPWIEAKNKCAKVNVKFDV